MKNTSKAEVMDNSSQYEESSSLYIELTELPSPGSYRGWSIYNVPRKIRKLNEEAYTPCLMSIGPLHHGKPHLKSMKRYKLEYCQKFLYLSGMGIENLIDEAKGWENEVREHYQDNIKYSSKEFVEMFVLDGTFIIMLFLKEKFPKNFAYNDVIFANQWMQRALLHDMMLLENQLPCFVLEKLLSMVRQELPDKITFSELTHHYFRLVGNTDKVSTKEIKEPRTRRHLVEYLLTFQLMGFDKKLARSTKKFEYTRSATELYAAGIKFISSQDRCILEIKYTNHGELTIPKLKVNESTETLFRNLIAFEQCDHQREYISSYIIFLDILINTPKDVDLLVKCGIIENFLGDSEPDSERVSNLFNNLCKETITEYSTFYYADICRQLNAYHRNFWHQWRATCYRWNVILKRDYFSTPWSVISVIAATVLLLLTVTQTVCSIMGL
ncbi:hypothetical protein Acr_00g0039140 [Actinidia rufa]|uniref:Transmembrane protein n=1 Tax=Actinidia rufa TaxID=165716 RepID=A0A7J0DHC6_9ERIC|nr:hypothetical protein Acr_00g0039140 [Actinidia rufa]